MEKIVYITIIASLALPFFAGVAGAQNLPKPVVYFSADPDSIKHGDTITLSWSTLYATKCTAKGEWSGNKSVIGSEKVRPEETGELTYSLRCSGQGGTTTEDIEIFVKIDQKEAPSVILKIEPRVIDEDRSTRIEWFSAGADKCVAAEGWNDWTGEKRTSGRQTIRPEGTGPYSITCENQYGKTTKQVTVIVNKKTTSPTIRGPLSASCVAYPASVLPQREITFAASAFGGNPPYTFSWSGDVNGKGILRTTIFKDVGFKNAKVTAEDVSGNLVDAICSVQVTQNPSPVFVATSQPGNNIFYRSGGGNKSYSGAAAAWEARRLAETRKDSRDQGVALVGSGILNDSNDDSSKPSGPLETLRRFAGDESSRQNTAAVGAAFLGGIKILGWVLLAIFNIALLVALGFTIVAIKKETENLRGPKEDWNEILGAISSLEAQNS